MMFFLGACLTQVAIPRSVWAQAVKGTPTWQEIAAKASKENQVVVLGSHDPTVRRSLAERFSKAFGGRHGISLQYQVGKFDTLVQRIEAELTSGRGTFDVAIGGGGENFLHLVEPLAPRLLLSEVTDVSKWKEKTFKWLDKENRNVFQISEWAIGGVFVNTSQIDPASITSWNDLLKPQFKGKITTSDPIGTGAGRLIAAYLLYKFGEDFVRKLYLDQQVVLTRAYPQIAEWIARGKHPIGLSPPVRDIERFKAEGIPIKALILPDGPGLIQAGTGTVYIVKGAPHPNAATFFVNWLLTKEGQEAFSQPMGYPSRRIDVSTNHVPEAIIPKAGLDYIDGDSSEWLHNKRPALERRVAELLGR
jgi:iron(III) transport system substrate-binding protein